MADTSEEEKESDLITRFTNFVDSNIRLVKVIVIFRFMNKSMALLVSFFHHFISSEENKICFGLLQSISWLMAGTGIIIILRKTYAVSAMSYK